MQNSVDSTQTLQKDKDDKDISVVPNSDLPKEVPKPDPPNEPSKSELPKEAPKSEPVKTQPPKSPAVTPSKGMVKNRCLRSPQGTLKKFSLSAPARRLEEISSNLSMAQPVSEMETECEDTPKLRQQFTKPRMNRLTEQRIQRLQSAANVQVASTFSPRIKRQNSKLSDQISLGGALSSHPSETELRSTNDTFDGMLSKLKDLQTKFMQKATGLPQPNNVIYKLVSLVQNDSCKFVLHKDDSFGLPKDLPAESVDDLKTCCRRAFDTSCILFFDKLSGVQLAKDQATAELVRKELQVQIKSDLNIKVEAIENELEKLNTLDNNTEESSLRNEIKELKASKATLSDLNSKQETLLVKMQSSKEELKKLLTESHMANKKLSLELADKNIEMNGQCGKIDEQKKEIKLMKNMNKVVQQRLKENEDALSSQRTECTELKQKEKQMLKEMTELRKRVKELSHKLGEKEAELLELQAQRHEQSQLEYSTRTDQAQIKELQKKLELQAEVEKQLHALVEQKQGLQNTLEQKISRMQDQIEQHRQVLVVRGDRISSLDSELKQREHESNRKITDLMTLTNDKNAVITQITNELASTNEQFQNLCTTLSIKQSKLHSQEHVIKLLEESNARSVKLHTKLAEKNTLLKDELDHLRRTVNTLMLGSHARDVEAADIRLE